MGTQQVIIPKVIVLAALANYREDIGLPSEARSLQPSEFRALQSTLFELGLIKAEEVRSTLFETEKEDGLTDEDYVDAFNEERNAHFDYQADTITINTDKL